VAAALTIVAGPSQASSSVQITTCGQTVTTNAVLTQDLSCAGQGVNVNASGITIDLQGHTLKGNGSAVGISDGGYDHVAIKNGVVRNFADGVFATNGADGVTISNVALSANVTLGAYIKGDSASIASSTVSGNGDGGIVVYGLSASIKSTTVSGSGQDGIDVWGDSASVVSSTAAENAGHGIAVTGNATTVKSSNAVDNAMYGFYLEGDSTSVTSSTASGNSWNGLLVVGNSASVKSTKAFGNAWRGITVLGNAAAVSGNRADGNGFEGHSSDGLGLGIFVGNYTAAPVGTNVAGGNDDPARCQPSSLCPAAGSSKAAGTPISTCGQVVTTNAVLTQDLTCATDAIVVGASGITVDLHGHTLTGDHVHDGISDDGYDHVRIKNGVLRGFYVGVYAVNGADSTNLSNVVLSGDSIQGAYITGNYVSIASSTVSGNGDHGIYVEGDSASIKSTTASENGQSGILVYGTAAKIASSTVAGNAVHGIWVNGNKASVKSSSAVGNGSTGVRLVGDSNSLTSSTASGNGSGVLIDGSSPSIKSTKAAGNANIGIFVSGAAARITANTADGNGFVAGVSDGTGRGIYADNFTTAPVGKNLARGNDDPTSCAPASLC
jgi:hypothetical protein